MRQVFLESVSVIGPGLPNWETATSVLRGETPLVLADVALPPAALLPPTERRRTGTATRLSMALGVEAAEKAGVALAALPSVFVSTGGDCENCHQILETLASDDRSISPTRFHNSVHNAAAGYWSIGAKSMETSTSLCAYDATFGAGLLEALPLVVSLEKPVLLIAFDSAYPDPLNAIRPIPYPFGVGMVFSPVQTAQSLASVRFALTDEASAQMEDAALEALRLMVPAARALPMLALLANQTAGRVVVDYLAPSQLAIEVTCL